MTTATDASRFSPDTSVYHPTYGVGTLTAAEETRVEAADIPMYVVVFPREKLTLRIPQHRATNVLCTLSQIASSKRIETAVKLIGQHRVTADSTNRLWQKRLDAYEAKVHSGKLLDLAEAIRDMNRDSDEKSTLSYRERNLLVRATLRLLDIIVAVTGKSPDRVEQELQAAVAERKKPLQFS